MPQFEIGLVMAGAVSAGAYTAGTVDFLLQALDTWQDAKTAKVADTPPHEVKLKVLTGASAGGITAGIVASILGEELPPIDDYPTNAKGDQNKLFDAWVNRVDISRLLDHDDLDSDRTLAARSLLDSTVLDEIGQRVFEAGPRRSTPRPYLSDPLAVAVTLTNLRGVPYKIDFTSLSSTHSPYVMNMHADAMLFSVGTPTPKPVTSSTGGHDTLRSAITLDPKLVGLGDWPMLREAALATAAFPFGLIPRKLVRPAEVYDQREWYFAHPRTVNGKHECGFLGTLTPFWDVKPDFQYEFLTVDGGTMDNEPIGLARSLLMPGDPTGALTSGATTQSAIVMIDPFPDATPFQTEDPFAKEYNLFKLAPKIIRSLINQARFKPAELTHAVDPSVFNQFLIAPVRYDANGTPITENPIACGGLGGFGGFLSRDFRVHDFQLGRLNAQQFLRSHFVLPELVASGTDQPPDGSPKQVINPLFAGWTDAARNKYRIHRDANGRLVQPDGKVVAEDGSRQVATGPLTAYLPIVPLIGRVEQDERRPTWPSFSRTVLRGGTKSIRERIFGRTVQSLQERISDRLTRVVDRLVETTNGFFTRRLLFAAWRLKRDEIIEDIVAQIETDFTQRQLLSD